MTTPSPRRCSALPSIGRSFRSRGSPICSHRQTMGDALRPVSARTKDEHRHSGIRYVTRRGGRAGQDGRILAARHVVYQDARSRNPQRWSGQTRNWKPVGVVTLNPERDIIIRAATSQILLSGSIGEPAFPSRPGSAAQAGGAHRRRRRRRTPAATSAARPAACASMARMASAGPSPQ